MSQRAATGADSPVEFFPALSALDFVRHGFIGRIPGIDVATDREAALSRLDAAHREIRAELGLDDRHFVTAEQIHGNEVAVIDRPLVADQCCAGVDGLLSNERGLSLGIYVADCCAIFLVDPVKRCIGLVHSGRNGTKLAVVARAIGQLRERFGSDPADLLVELSPCIRPPHYEVDFAAEIVRQLRHAGMKQIHDANICSACDLERYYSYRLEKGRTGRMLALLALA